VGAVVSVVVAAGAASVEGAAPLSDDAAAGVAVVGGSS
jgi:hypothetical protein